MQVKYNERGDLIFPRNFAETRKLLELVREGRVALKQPQEPVQVGKKSFAELRKIAIKRGAAPADHARREVGQGNEGQAVTQQPITILKNLEGGKTLCFVRTNCGGTCRLI